jgi:ribosomal protein S18 acetylase RimI-like enzyme
MAAETQVKTYRVAVSGDEAGILDVFAEVAAEVPTAVRPQTEGLIKRWVATGLSWVAIADDEIVGYALAEMYDKSTLSLVYLGVSKAARNQSVSSSLVSKLKESGASIITDVRSNNTSSMVERFEHFGFVKGDVDANRTKLRWEKVGHNG